MSSPLGYNSSLDRPIEEEDPAQQSLRDRQLRTLFETVLDAIAIVDDQGRYLDVNPAACELFGLERDKLLGCCISEFAEPGYEFQAVWQAFQQQEKMRGEFRLVRSDGEIRVVEYAATANFLPHRHLSVMRDITERKQAEEQVRELTRQLAQAQTQLQQIGNEPVNINTFIEDRRLEQIARHIPGVIYQFRMRPDGTLHFPYSSEGLREIYGVSPEEVREDASKLFSCVHPEDLDRVTQSIFKSAEELTPWYCEYRVCLPDGRLVWSLGHSTPQRQSDGSTVWHGYIRDITDSKQAEADKQRQLAILESTSDLIGTADGTGKVLYLNRAWRNLFGNNEAKLANLEISTFHPKWALDIILNQGLPEAMRAGIWCGETAIVDLTGREIPVSQVILAHKSTNGNVEYFSTILRDITESKATEIALQESNSRWQLAIEGAGDGTWDWNLKTNEVIFSRQWKAMLGYAESELPNTIEEWESRLHPEDKAHCYADFSKHLKGETFTYRNEHRLRCQDGSYKWILDRGQVIEWDKEGQPLRFIGTHCDITDRKEAETQLHEISERLSLALKSGKIGCWEWDLVQNNLFWDERMYELYGVTKNSDSRLLYDIWSQGLHPDDRDASETLVRQAALGKAEFDIEFRVIHPDGSIHFIKAFGLLQRDAEGNPQKIIGINFDISDRKRAEAELKQAKVELEETEKFLRSIYEGVGSLIFVVDVLEDRELIYAGWSLSTEKATGIKAADIMGKTPEAIFGLTEGAAVRQNQLRCIQAGTSISYEECLTFNNQETWWLTTLNPIKNSENRIYRIVGTTIEITDRKRQEQALFLIVEGTAAKTGEEFFKSCVQYLAQVLGVRYASIAEFVDSEKAIVKTLAFWAGDDFSDNITYRVTGKPCENVNSNDSVCRYPNSLPSLFPEDDVLISLQAESYAGLPIIDAAGNRLGLLSVLDTKPMVKDLELQSAILKIFAVRAGAEIERIQAEAAVRQSEIQLRQQTQELEITLKKLQNTQTQLIQAEKMSSLGQLVAGVAHEINNPVSFIYSNIEPAADYARDLIELIKLYQYHYPNPPQAIDEFIENIEFEYLASDFSKLLESMRNGATRIRDIVKSLRTFSRLDEADLKEIDIHENIESTLVILQNRLNGRSGKPEIHLIKNYGKLPPIECYGGLLNQVFMNLLINAIDAIDQQRQSLEPTGNIDYMGTIAIATSIISEERISISIHDNGCGMSSQVKEKIFNPFFTTKPIGKGTGMGLANSYQIVTKNHQGDLHCSSTLGEGTELRIELPIRALQSSSNLAFDKIES